MESYEKYLSESKTHVSVLSSIVEIVEKHISPQVLPKESSVSWIKWVSDTAFDKLILRYEADVKINRLFNVDDKIFEISSQQDRRLVIPKEMLQIDGFFGFESRYMAISGDGKRTVSYEIDIVSGDKIQTVHLEHVVTRPVIKVVKLSPATIYISKSSVSPVSLLVELESLEAATAHNLTYVIDVKTGDDLQVDVSPKEACVPQLFDRLSSAQKISVKGKGCGLMQVGVEYEDACGTKYFTLIGSIPIYAREMQEKSFPIVENLQRHKAQILTVLG